VTEFITIVTKSAGSGKQTGTHDPELFKIIERALGGEVVSCQLVTSLLGPIPRRAYRVTLKDGRGIKVRQVSNEGRAEKIASALGQLNPKHFPQLFAREGTTLLLQWMPGKVLNTFAPDDGLYRACGRLLAEIHLTPFEGAIDPKELLLEILPRTLSDVAQMVAWGLLSPEEGAELSLRLQTRIPSDGIPTLIHGDYCGENLILDQKQNICSIDNEALNIGLPEADIARALLRWNLSGREREIFLSGYGELRSLEEYYLSSRFWRQMSLIRSVRFRFRCPGVDHQPELSRLKQTLVEAAP